MFERACCDKIICWIVQVNIDIFEHDNETIADNIMHAHERLTSLEKKFGNHYEIISVKRNRHERFFFIGGTNGHGNILDVTRGHFKTSFVGCIRKIVVQNVVLTNAFFVQTMSSCQTIDRVSQLIGH